MHFGSRGYSEFTLHKNEESNEKCMQRHKKNENWKDYNIAGFYAKHTLWNKPTINESIKYTNKKFKKLHKIKAFLIYIIYIHQSTNHSLVNSSFQYFL